MFRTATLETSLKRLWSRRVIEKTYPFLKRIPRQKSILDKHPELRPKIERIKWQILGHAPPSYNYQRTGYQRAKKQYDGVYLTQYYTEHEEVDKYARKVMPGWKNEKQQRRAEKLVKLRRLGKGPPKKGTKKRKK